MKRVPLIARPEAPSLSHLRWSIATAASAGELLKILAAEAKNLVAADGVALIVRDGDFCHYVDEDAMTPLWKGRKFPLVSCISGWVILHKELVYLPDVFADVRIPQDLYRPTFVKSLLMLPMGHDAPVGAFGVYWAKRRQPKAADTLILQALAHSSAPTIERLFCKNQVPGR